MRIAVTGAAGNLGSKLVKQRRAARRDNYLASRFGESLRNSMSASSLR